MGKGELEILRLNVFKTRRAKHCLSKNAVAEKEVVLLKIYAKKSN